MNWLEHRIPPPIVALLFALAMWFVAGIGLRFAFAFPVRLGLGLTWAIVGFSMSLAGAAAFRRAQTTVNPLKPETASKLVVLGIFHHTRNPMYLGMSCVLLGWAIYLAAPFALLGPLLFAAYITRFQILPEERALEQLFGQDFADYCAKVRRWI